MDIPLYVKKPSKEAKKLALFMGPNGRAIKIAVIIVILLLAAMAIISGGYLVFLFLM